MAERDRFENSGASILGNVEQLFITIIKITLNTSKYLQTLTIPGKA